MRAGKTKTTSFSLDAETLSNLKKLAARRHKGNVSALLAEVATREEKFAAADRFLALVNAPPLTEAEAARIENEWKTALQRPRARKRVA